jgi:hypothetical protein
MEKSEEYYERNLRKKYSLCRALPFHRLRKSTNSLFTLNKSLKWRGLPLSGPYGTARMVKMAPFITVAYTLLTQFERDAATRPMIGQTVETIKEVRARLGM